MRSPGFFRLNQEGRTGEVVRRLREAIDLGFLSEGDQLPSETELATQLGVATVTLREALVLLRQSGLIRTLRGRNGGSFVCAPAIIPEVLLFDQLKEMSTNDLRDLSDEHIAISGAAARLAAKRSTLEHHQRFKLWNEELKKSELRSERRRADARFHIEIAVASQSVRLTQAEQRLQGEIGEFHWVAMDHSNIDSVVNEHEGIIEAIISGDTNLAGALAEAHVAKAMRRLVDLRLKLLTSEQSCAAEASSDGAKFA